ncbi:hypothetical protein [Komagataeibacter nataicola]|uniref:Holin n=1 Tax=Komagataeibacter nataicola TaxID=265960 RepID=A0ABX5P7L1_9PROT|nr:hypothetical protein [Komagataeibacter nataicola]PYD65228.1 hypothetical protein CDI09_14650 [Komagataeibacter nataicola]WNM07302.1 hypothetical protein RI056_00225 [Komagataeibacter nataicola]
MDDIIALIAKAVAVGGPDVVICLLLGFIFYLLVTINNLNKKLDEKDEAFNRLVQESNENSKEMAKALSELRVTISEINGKLST